MSKIGSKIILIPAGAQVSLEEKVLRIRGPKGEMAREIPSSLKVIIEEGKLSVQRQSESKEVRSLHGLYRSLIANMFQGVTEGFICTLEIKGVGFRAEKTERELKLSLGFSHPVFLPIPEEIEIAVEGPIVKVSGIDKEKVHSFAAVIRSIKPPEIYKGKGIRYQGEVVTLKPGKSAKGAGAASGTA